MSTWRTTSPAQLSESDWNRWEEIQLTRPDLDSPFFHPELTRITATVRRDGEVATLQDGAGSVGFFPFQRGPHNRAHAVTGRLAEFHGAVTSTGLSWSPEDLIRSCHLSYWHFGRLPVSQTAFTGCVWGQSTSPFLGLADGYSCDRARMKRSGSSLAQVERKARKLERELGALRFEFHSLEPAVFAALLDWKTAQYRRTRRLEIFATSWVVNLLETVRQIDTAGFGGPLSALYAGDHLLAVHLGLRTRNALHIWFPAYNLQFERFSPGLVLLLRLAHVSLIGP